jgi:predicted transcriptional regulator
MPRRLKLSHLQRDILMMLEEAGAETVGTVVATLKPSHGEFTVQVDQLVTLGLIRRDGDSIVLTEQGKIALTS